MSKIVIYEKRKCTHLKSKRTKRKESTLLILASFSGFLAPLPSWLQKRHPKNGLIGIANISSHLINWCLVSSWPTVCKCTSHSLSLCSVCELLCSRVVSFQGHLAKIHLLTDPCLVLSLSSLNVFLHFSFLSFLFKFVFASSLPHLIRLSVCCWLSCSVTDHSQDTHPPQTSQSCNWPLLTTTYCACCAAVGQTDWLLQCFYILVWV